MVTPWVWRNSTPVAVIMLAMAFERAHSLLWYESYPPELKRERGDGSDKGNCFCVLWVLPDVGTDGGDVPGKGFETGRCSGLVRLSPREIARKAFGPEEVGISAANPLCFNWFLVWGFHAGKDHALAKILM